MLNPVWLKTFVTLVDTGHFTQTADKLFMTQPGVSQHINKLEMACGYSLIKREKKTFIVTEQGRLMYQHAQDLMQNEKALMEELAFDKPFSGDISLACSGSVALLLYPKLLKLQLAYSELVVRLKASPNYQILDDIKSGKIDLGIVTDKPSNATFDTKELAKEELCLIVPKGIDCEKNLKQILIDLGLISHPDAEHYLSLYFAQSKESDLAHLDINKIPVVGAVNQISQILLPVSKGIGFTILPKSALDSFDGKEYLKVVKPQSHVIETLYLVKKKNRALPERFKVINRVIESAW